MDKRPGTGVALDAALDAILAGDQESLLEAIRIIESHPRAQELRHLLTSAIETRDVVRVASPSDQARLRHLRMIGVACRELERARAAHRARDVQRWRRRVFRPVAVAVGSFGLLLPGALAVASTAQPGEALYGAKLTVENVQIALTTDPIKDIALHMRFAERRRQEIALLERSGNEGQPLTTAASNLKSHAEAVKHGVEEGNAPAGLAASLERHLDGLNTITDNARCSQGKAAAGCAGLEKAVASSTLALSQLQPDPAPAPTGGSPAGPTGPLATEDPSPSPSTVAAVKPTNDPQDAPRAPKTTSPGTTDPSATPTPSPAASETPAPEQTTTPAPTPDPSATPTPDPSATPTPDPSATPTPDPSASPSPDPAQPDPDPATQPDQSPPPDGSTIEPHSVGGSATQP